MASVSSCLQEAVFSRRQTQVEGRAPLMLWTCCHKSVNKWFPKKSCISLFGRFVLEFCSGKKSLTWKWCPASWSHTHRDGFWTVRQNVERLQRICAPILIVTLTCDWWSGAKAATASPAAANAACAHSIVNSRCHQIIWNVRKASQMEKLLGYATAAMEKKRSNIGDGRGPATAPAAELRKCVNMPNVLGPYSAIFQRRSGRA